VNKSLFRASGILRHPAVIVLSLVHIVLFLWGFDRGFYAAYDVTGFGVFYQYADNIMNGLWPYRDFPVEYPPLTLLLVIIPGFFMDTVAAFTFAFKLEILLFSLGIVVLLALFARRFGLGLWRTLGVYTLLLLAVGPIVMLRYDLPVTFVVLLALYLLITDRSRRAWVVLGLAVMLKLYAVVLAPMFLLWYWRRGEKRALVHGGLAFGITLAVISVVPLFLSAGGYLESFLYHSDRPLQLESLYASVLLAGQQLGWWTADTFYSFGSVNIDAPGAAFFASYYWLFAGAGLLLVYWLFNRFLTKSLTMKNKHGERDTATALGLVVFCAAAITVFMVLNKVLSPQFIIWLLPLTALVWRGNPWAWLLLFAAGWLTAYVYPLNYIELQLGEPAVTWVLLARNILLAGLAVVLVWRGFRGTGVT
jgi:uncharacterized membrane protein